MKIAADMCIYTNDHFTIETIKLDTPAATDGAAADSSSSGGGTNYP